MAKVIKNSEVTYDATFSEEEVHAIIVALTYTLNMTGAGGCPKTVKGMMTVQKALKEAGVKVDG